MCKKNCQLYWRTWWLGRAFRTKDGPLRPELSDLLTQARSHSSHDNYPDLQDLKIKGYPLCETPEKTV